VVAYGGVAMTLLPAILDYFTSSWIFGSMGLLLFIVYNAVLLCDERVSWRYYFRGSRREHSLRPFAIDMRFWILFILFPISFMYTCYMLGKHSSQISEWLAL
jgi:hypothetical protein